MLGIAGAQRACDRTFDIAEARVDPSKIGIGRTTSTGGPHHALQARLGDPVKAAEAVINTREPDAIERTA